MVARTSGNSSLAPARNPRAGASLAAGLLAVASVPVGILLARYSERVSLLSAAFSAVPAALLGLYAIVLARRARETVARTLGRAGGEGAARAGRALGILGVCVAATVGMAIGFFGLLTLFAS